MSVAQSILRSSRVLTEEDLLMFIDTLGVAQREAIAGRSDLTTKVSDALVLNGEQQVHRVLAGNMEIRLSRQAMLFFVKKAVEDEVLREHLALRPDLTPGVCQKLLPLVTGEAKQRLHSLIQGALSQEQLDQIARLKEVRRNLGPALDNQDMTLLWADAKRAKVTADELVLLLLQDKRFNHVIELMSTCGRIAQKALKDAVYNGKTETVLRTAARCRLKTHTFSLFAKARCAHLRIPDAQESEWVTAYSDYLKSLKPAVPGRGGDFKAKRGNRAAPSKKPVTGADLTVA